MDSALLVCCVCRGGYSATEILAASPGRLTGKQGKVGHSDCLEVGWGTCRGGIRNILPVNLTVYRKLGLTTSETYGSLA